eukprot:5786795-Amphidinium_carterae.1
MRTISWRLKQGNMVPSILRFKVPCFCAFLPRTIGKPQVPGTRWSWVVWVNGFGSYEPSRPRRLHGTTSILKCFDIVPLANNVRHGFRSEISPGGFLCVGGFRGEEAHIVKVLRVEGV